MTIEIALLISALSVGFGIYQIMANVKRNNKKDAEKGASEMTRVMVELKNISDGIAEIKSEIASVKTDTRFNRDDIIRIDVELKAVVKKVDAIEAKRQAQS